MTITTLFLLIGAIALVLTVLLGIFIQNLDSFLSWIYAFFRNFLGVFFIFSGTVKAIDPTGTGIKNGDYFAVFSEYLPSLDFLWNFSLEYALPIAMLVIIIEMILGVTLILGVFKKPTLWLYVALLVFFTFLTGFTTVTGKVTDCGCFGDFLKLEPKISFFKDLVLSAILLFLLLFSGKYLKPVFSNKIAIPFLIAATIFTVWFNFRNVNHLPIVDFRAYSKGTNLNDCTDTKNLDKGLSFIFYQMSNSKTGEKKEVESNEYINSGIWKDKNWKIDTSRTEVIRKPELPPCKDFIVLDGYGNEIQDDVKNQSGVMFFVGAYDIGKSSSKGFNIVNNTLNQANKEGFPIYGFTSSEIARANKQARGYGFYNLDAVPIKTMIRSNPGVVMLKDGTIVDKWHYNDLPDFNSIKKQYNL